MKLKAVSILASVAILEAMIIAGLVLSRGPFRVSYLPIIWNGRPAIMKTEVKPVQIVSSPINLALEYDAPDKKFEEVVKKNLGWLPYRPLPESYTVLGECADLSRTNYVRILIENGADVDVAVKDLTAVNQADAVKLLKQIQLEVSRAGTNSLTPTGNR